MDFPDPRGAIRELLSSSAGCVRTIGLLLFFCVCAAADGAEPVPIALAPVAAPSPRTDPLPYGEAIDSLLSFELSSVKSLRIVASGRSGVAEHELGLVPGQLMNLEQARKYGVTCQAQQVFWGTYSHDASGWHLAMKAMNVQTGKLVELNPSSDARLSNSVNGALEIMLSYLGISMSPEERRQMQTPLTTSDEALGYVCQAISELNNGGKLENAMKHYRAALALDPNFAEAKAELAHCLLAADRYEEALRLAKEVIAEHPDYGRGYYEAGLAHDEEGLNHLARKEFMRALELDPERPDYAFPLAVDEILQNDWTNAMSLLESAQNWDRFNANTHVLLGTCYAHLQRTNDAYKQLSMAEKYNYSNDPLVEQWLANGYREMGEPQLQVMEHLKRFVSLSDASGFQLPQVDEARSTVTKLEMRAVAHPVAVSEPAGYTASEFEAALSKRLTPDELKLVANPLTASPRMEQWARELVGDARDDMEKAKRLFDGLTRRINRGENRKLRTAIQVFEDWPNSDAAIVCQDYTVLYVALARSVGLRAYYVLVIRDYAGHYGGHACAGVFLNGSAYLVDPAYFWFGVPHKEYEVEDDLRVAALYILQGEDARKIQLALKIAFDWSGTHLEASHEYAAQGDLAKADDEVELVLKSNPNDCRTLYEKTFVTALKQDWTGAEAYARKCLAANPDVPHVRPLLAASLYAQGKVNEARDEINSMLDGKHKDDESGARALLQDIDTGSFKIQQPGAKTEPATPATHFK